MLENKDYCDYDTCVALKELGFNQYNSIRYYAGVGGVKLWDFDGEPNYKEGELIALNDLYDVPRDGNEVAAPSLYEAQKFMRKEKNLHLEITYSPSCWTGKIYDLKEWDYIKGFTFFESFEDALHTLIKEAVKILKEE